jgi:F0F1-type ATP synthase membrane subunit c/vacuolar-type H+-ATPase subunit K
MECMNRAFVLNRQMPRSPGAIRAQRSGLLTMAVFTGAWSILGLVSGVLLLQITAGVLIVAALYFLIRSTRVGASARAARIQPRQASQAPLPSDSRFVIAVVVETVAIAAMVFVMLHLHLPQYVVPLVAVIVGGHFFIFIRPGDRVVHLIAGIVGVAVGLLGVALIGGAILDPVVVRGIVGCSFAVITTYYGCYFLTWRYTETGDGETR